MLLAGSTVEGRMGGGAPIRIVGKRQLKDARDARDDWTGTTDAKERRKAQNRLHQRAWRRKKIEEKSKYTASNSSEESTSNYATSDTLLAAFEAATSAFTNITTYKAYPPLIPYLTPAQWPSERSSTFLTIPAHFPLSADHHLLTLIQYNVMRAILENMVLCNILNAVPLECRNALNLPLAHHPPSTPPPTFARTALQKAIPHADWIDSFPCARMRDNLIRACPSSVFPSSADPTHGEDFQRGSAKLFDEDELCADTCGGLYEGYDECAAKGLLVWGEPWRVESWEVSEGFTKKWGWLLEGCEDIVRVTNVWREARGEKGIVLGEC
ncbi:unnamed protein product [Periconia digitata]|uniref:BZIP domain-containing protein n=1 Tax=Periconia digitata TaxID=1303443 RepID=A0A9W4U5T3_9PLEO|nr:unnamed protein product [Periconia digitata]